MIKIVILFVVAIHQISAGAVELLPTAQVAPVTQALVTARSSQYFAQNHNAFAAPLVAQYVAPVTRYITPASSSYTSSVIQYTAPLNQYIATAPLIQPNLAVAPTASLIARPPLAIASPQPIAVAQPVPAQQPIGPAQNPDDESIEIESARVRTLPQAQVQQPQQGTPLARIQSFPQPNLSLAQHNLIARYQQQAVQQGAQNGRVSSAPIVKATNQQSQINAEVSGRNVAQQQQVVARNGALIGAPGLLSAQQYVQGPYFV